MARTGMYIFPAYLQLSVKTKVYFKYFKILIFDLDMKFSFFGITIRLN